MASDTEIIYNTLVAKGVYVEDKTIGAILNSINTQINYAGSFKVIPYKFTLNSKLANGDPEQLAKVVAEPGDWDYQILLGPGIVEIVCDFEKPVAPKMLVGYYGGYRFQENVVGWYLTVIDGSNDKTNWTRIYYIGGDDNTCKTRVVPVVFVHSATNFVTTAYRYMRFRMSSGWSGYTSFNGFKFLI